jgi:intein/homing endonuclease
MGDLCPIVTTYTDTLGIPPSLLEKLWEIRTWDIDGVKEGRVNPIPFRWPTLLKKEFIQDGELHPLVLREYQKQQIFHHTRLPRHINGDGVGLGKAQPLTAKVLTPYGWKSMGDLKVGDAITDPDGGTGKVEAIFPQGIKSIFKFITNDGGSTECCEEHLWTVQTSHDRENKKFRTLSTKQLLDIGLQDRRKTSNFFLPIAAVSKGLRSEGLLLIKPYSMGALLGDGGFREPGVSISNVDEEILSRVRAELPLELFLRRIIPDGCDYSITTGLKKPNPYIRALVKLGLWGKKSPDKHIPKQYLTASAAVRKELLRGLLDTDGECSKNGLVYLGTSSKSLAEDTAFLVRSLGGMATLRGPNKGKFYEYKGERRQGLPGYNLTIKTHFNPFHLKRKAERWKLPLFARAIVSIEPVGEKEAQCIRVSTKRNLYITDDHIVTHNTIDVIASACWVKERHPNAKFLVLTTKSTTWQWGSEFSKFSDLRPFVMVDEYKGQSSYKARLQQLRDFLAGAKKDVMVCKYTSVIGKRKKGVGQFDVDGNPTNNGTEVISEEIKEFCRICMANREDLWIILDECQKFKGVGNAIRQLIANLCNRTDHVWALTATVVKNDLAEFYSISSALNIRPFGYLDDFNEKFCIFEKQHRGNGIFEDVLRGYHNLKDFREGMRPFFLGRSQAQVKEPLPKLSTSYIPIDLSAEQVKLLLHDIPEGTYQLPPSVTKVAGEIIIKDRNPDNLMTMMSVYQLVANHPALLDPSDKEKFLTPKLSPKEEELLYLLDGGDLVGEKVICYAQPLDSKILTPSGWKTMGEMNIGTEVVDPDTGEKAEVIGVYPQGVKPIYRVTTKSGAVTEATEDHLWLVQSHKKTWRVRNTRQIIDRGLQRKDPRESNVNRYNKAFLPIAKETRFSQNGDLPIPPYTLGVLLGDGDISSGKGIEFSVDDSEIAERVKQECPIGMTVHDRKLYYKHPSGNIHPGYSLVSTTPTEKDEQGYNIGGNNRYLNSIKEMNLCCDSYTKFIPEKYLHSSIEDRIELLRGYLDTDGCCGEGQVTVGSASKQLILDAAELVRSLGGLAYFSGPERTFYTHNGVRKEGATGWSLTIQVSFNPFHLERKTELWHPAKSVLNPIKSIEYVGEKECQCIRVSSKRSLYITDDYIVTHNTKYRTWIDRLDALTNAGQFTRRKFLRITGAESEKTRDINKRLFQSTAEHDLIVINNAGMEGINLQSAAHMILLDCPWSWGDLIQLVGRMVRMASPHSACTLHIMAAKGTMDEYTIEVLKGKKGIFETILGESHSAGILDNNLEINLDSGMDQAGTDEEFRRMLTAHVKSVSMKSFTDGKLLFRASTDSDYKMIFEEGGKKPRRGGGKFAQMQDKYQGKWDFPEAE